MSDVIESIQTADFGGQLTLKRARQDLDDAKGLVHQIAQELLALKRQSASRDTAINLLKNHLKTIPITSPSGAPGSRMPLTGKTPITVTATGTMPPDDSCRCVRFPTITT